MVVGKTSWLKRRLLGVDKAKEIKRLDRFDGFLLVFAVSVFVFGVDTLRVAATNSAYDPLRNKVIVLALVVGCLLATVALFARVVRNVREARSKHPHVFS